MSKSRKKTRNADKIKKAGVIPWQISEDNIFVVVFFFLIFQEKLLKETLEDIQGKFLGQFLKNFLEKL